jgi:hypothetical protein
MTRSKGLLVVSCLIAACGDDGTTAVVPDAGGAAGANAGTGPAGTSGSGGNAGAAGTSARDPNPWGESFRSFTACSEVGGNVTPVRALPDGGFVIQLGDHVCAFESDGTTRWRAQLEGIDDTFRLPLYINEVEVNAAGIILGGVFKPDDGEHAARDVSGQYMVARLDPEDGATTWLTKVPGKQSNTPDDSCWHAAGRDGSIYIQGMYDLQSEDDPAALDIFTGTSIAPHAPVLDGSPFLFRIAADGTLQDTFIHTPNGKPFTDAAGNLYVIGENLPRTSSPVKGFYGVKLDPDGRLEWEVNAPGGAGDAGDAGNPRGEGRVKLHDVGADGSVVVTLMDSRTDWTDATLPMTDSSRAYLVRFDAQGQRDWAEELTTSCPVDHLIALDDGSIFVASEYSATTGVCQRKLDVDGEELWSNVWAQEDLSWTPRAYEQVGDALRVWGSGWSAHSNRVEHVVGDLDLETGAPR